MLATIAQLWTHLRSAWQINAIALALLQADVDVKLVRKLQENIRANVNLEEVAAGRDKRKLIERVRLTPVLVARYSPLSCVARL